jgi:hypothetical protein
MSDDKCPHCGASPRPVNVGSLIGKIRETVHTFDCPESVRARAIVAEKLGGGDTK